VGPPFSFRAQPGLPILGSLPHTTHSPTLLRSKKPTDSQPLPREERFFIVPAQRLIGPMAANIGFMSYDERSLSLLKVGQKGEFRVTTVSDACTERCICLTRTAFLALMLAISSAATAATTSDAGGSPNRTALSGGSISLTGAAAGNSVLTLTMITGVGQGRLASINGEAFAAGELHRIKLGEKRVMLQCIEIRESSAIIKIEGETNPRELMLGKRTEIVAAKSPVIKTEAIQARAADLRSKFSFRQPDFGQITLDPQARWVALSTGVLLLLIGVYYIQFSRACSQLCRRTGAPSAILIWLPYLKRLPLFKAVGLSRIFFLVGLVVPFVGGIAWIVCCLRLCETFHCSKWLVIVMLVPLVGWSVFLYLARESAEDDNEPAVRNPFVFG
jgi:hypothetical protein